MKQIRKKMKTVFVLLMALVMTLLITGCAGAAGKNNDEEKLTISTQSAVQASEKDTDPEQNAVAEDGEYTSKDEVALYIHLYGHLPDNYITKNEAKELGWISTRGNLWKVAPGKSIGGDRFGNREGSLPEKKGRKYYECDLDFDGGTRNAKRLIYSNDGLVYYTEDHYNSFELLYGEE